MLKGVVCGIDFGKKIGLAFSNYEQTIALPHSTQTCIETTSVLMIEKKTRFLVIGWPLQLDGKEGEQCKKTKNMLEKLLHFVNLPYFLQDERFSSRMFKGCKNEDALSASWILETALNANFLENQQI